MSNFTVTAAAMRSASQKQECFYCHQPVGGKHLDSCVTIKRKVRIRYTIEYDTWMPASWSALDKENHLNNSSYCGTNIFEEIEKHRKKIGRNCYCGLGNAVVVRMDPDLDIYLSEG